MRHPIRMSIIDRQSVLSDVDIHQVENMTWLRLAPYKRQVQRVKFKISRLDHQQFGSEHIVEYEVLLSSGKVVETCTTRVSKGAVLMSSVDHMKGAVVRRLKFESSLIFRSYAAVSSAVHERVRLLAGGTRNGIKRCSNFPTR